MFFGLQGFSPDNMVPWKTHWDRQLYKALEHQYMMGLEALNENLPEICVELTYRYADNELKKLNKKPSNSFWYN